MTADGGQSESVPAEREPALASGVADTGGFVDLTLPSSPWRYLPWIIGAVIVFVGPAVLATVLDETDALSSASSAWLVVGLLVAVTWVAAYVGWQGDGIVAIDRSLRQRLDDASCTGLESALADVDWSPVDADRASKLLPRVGRSMIRAGHAGYAIRVSVRRPCKDARPRGIEVPFEPIQLRESDLAFIGLEQLVRGDGATSGSAPRDESSTRPTRRARRDRGVRAARRMMWVQGVLACFAFIGLLVRPNLFWAYLLAWSIPAVWHLTKRGPRSSWWLFPGGLAVPPRPGHKSWRIVQRSDHVLFYLPGSLRVVGPGVDDVKSIVATDREAELAMRAWLATVPPPTDEQLKAAFAG